jgi:hypothetical protein
VREGAIISGGKAWPCKPMVIENRGHFSAQYARARDMVLDQQRSPPSVVVIGVLVPP